MADPYTTNINPNFPGLDQSISTGQRVTTRASTFLYSASAGAIIAALVDPFGAGSTYATVGPVPGQLALSGGNIVRGASAAIAGTEYKMKVLATAADGLRETSAVLSFTARDVAPVIVTPTPTPSPTVTLSASQSKPEGSSDGTVFTYAVTRSAVLGATSVPWSFMPGSTSADDFTGGTYPAGGSIALADGVATGTFAVSVNGDTSVEGDETFTVLISTPPGYVAGNATSATGTILNDDAAAVPTLGALSLSGSLVLGVPSNGTISGAIVDEVVTSNRAGLNVDSAARTYTFDGSGSAGTVANGLVGTHPTASNSPRPSPITVTSNAFAAFQTPVADSRKVATAVTVDGVANAALLAQQASVSTKDRSASITVGATPVVVIYDHPAGREVWPTWTGLGTSANQTVVEYWDGTQWVNNNAVNIGLATSPAFKRQIWWVPGSATRTRLTFSTTGTSYTVKLFLKEKPASGKSDILVDLDNSQANEVRGRNGMEEAIIAANPGTDMLYFNFGADGASAADIINNFDTMMTKMSRFASYIHVGQMVAGANTSGYPNERPQPSTTYPTTAAAHSILDPIIDTLPPKISAAGLIPFFSGITYRTYTNEGPNALPGSEGPGGVDGQENGSLFFNREIMNPKIASYAPEQYDTLYARPKIDSYLGYLYRRSAITDGIHPTSSSGTYTLASIQQWWAETLFRRMLTGTFPVPEIEQRIATAEATLLTSDYNEVVNALVALTASAGKTAIANRRATLLPLTMLKTANLAVAAYETSKTAPDKVTAQAAVTGAVNAGSSASDVATAYGNTINLSGTTALTTRINAVSSITVSKRAKSTLGRSAIAGYNAVLDETQKSTALVDTVGTATGFTLGITGFSGGSGLNGSGIAGGVAPDNVTASAMGGYINASGGVGTVFYSGLDTAKLYRFFLFSGNNSSTDRSMSWTATHNGAPVTTPVKNPAAVTVLFGPDDGLTGLVPINGGSGTISTTSASTTVTVSAMTAGMFAPGMPFTAAGVPAGTVIASMGTSVGGTGTLVLSQAATATATGVSAAATGGVIRFQTARGGANGSSTYAGPQIINEYS